MTDRWRVAANLATLSNALLGVGAIAYTLAGNKVWAMLLIVMAIGFDGLDGMLSRRSRGPSARFGAVANSVADAISFGVAPAVLLAVHTTNVSAWSGWELALTVVAGLYLAAAIARLTYFTARLHDLPHFRGVPTPESALAVVMLLLFHDIPGYAGIAPLGVVIGGVLLAAMMVAPVPYPKIRRGAPLRTPAAATAAFAALALLPLQFRPASGSVLAVAAECGAYGLLAGVAVYYLVGPFTVERAPPAAAAP